MMTPYRLLPHDPALAQVLTLIQTEFAYMDGLIDPPSSVHALTLTDLQNPTHEVWSIGHPPAACMILTAKPLALYIGKLAVAAHARRRGLGTILINTAAARARALGLTYLELQTRVELVANQAAFAAMGFVETD